ncbi:MAG: DUF551 domain-containing protein [Bacillota bacterium]
MSVLERIKRGELANVVYVKQGDMLYCTDADAAKELLRLAEIGERSRWVPVSEKTPDDGQYVDVWGPKIGRITHAKYCRETDDFYDGFGWIDEAATHWMLIPEPPKEGGGE